MAAASENIGRAGRKITMTQLGAVPFACVWGVARDRIARRNGLEVACFRNESYETVL